MHSEVSMKALFVTIAVIVWLGAIALIDSKINDICPIDGWALPIVASIPLAVVGLVIIGLCATQPHSEKG